MALTAMMQHYLQMKSEHKDCILLYRLGDFYEMFFDDAILVSRELELTLTGKDCGLKERAPMCGVPYHAVDQYIQKLIAKGYHVAICEQLSDPALSKGLVERGITQIITPGTYMPANEINRKDNRYLLCIYVNKTHDRVGYAYCDVSTGELIVSQDRNPLEIEYQISRIDPKEILCNPEASGYIQEEEFRAMLSVLEEERFDLNGARTALKAQLSQPLSAYGCERMPLAVAACGAVLWYLHTTQFNDLEHINSLRVYLPRDHMLLEASARRSLELVQSIQGQRNTGTLLHVLDKTQTAMGGRLLRSWLEEPLINLSEIHKRQDAVEELLNAYPQRQEITDSLRSVYDLERILSKLALNSINARDMLALHRSLTSLPHILSVLEPFTSAYLDELRSEIDPMEELCLRIENTISEDAPIQTTEGGIIRSGFSPELDELRAASKSGKDWVLEMEARERDATGIRNLKIGFNRVMGYYIDVTKSNLNLVPAYYVRKQTLTNSERYITPDLKQLEDKILSAEERSQKLEYEIFVELRNEMHRLLARIKRTAQAVKTLDVLCSFAQVAQERHYCKPEVNDGFDLIIQDGRHPVVEAMIDENFVPNDIHLTPEERFMVITGPNMAGKSTYMRQVALIVLMAHIGSFVPAKKAVISVTDAIFTRVGASDDLAGGRSTFMVEMNELSDIVKHATKNSLIILDEIGRGTSTLDGLSIAWASAEYIANPKRLGAKTLFATHYHELSELEGKIEGVVNYRSEVEEFKDEIIFLRKITRGNAESSYGIQVASLAGLPDPMINRAREIQARIEASSINKQSVGENLINGPKVKPRQVSLTDYDAVGFAQEIAALDVKNITPIEALNLLYKLTERAKLI
ncbi:MAG: DNA mismatch repair protein MutS [Clostridia bacterium]|nr:DNA mismatch repair protein MutS [Clostridia bacterium]